MLSDERIAELLPDPQQALYVGSNGICLKQNMPGPKNYKHPISLRTKRSFPGDGVCSISTG